MNQPGDRPPPFLELVPATPAEEPILANLLELYVHDFSDFLDIHLDQTGRFSISMLALYWTDPNRHPFLIRHNGRLAGFALVVREFEKRELEKQQFELSAQAGVWDIAEFFIIRGYRRRGLGTLAAHALWRRFPGPWQVRVRQGNLPAQRFWAEAISAFARQPVLGEMVKKDGTFWTVFSFESFSK